ncbi:MAG: SMP-30/gluconolactonase/LRE family protein [Myxococcota bacterium]
MWLVLAGCSGPGTDPTDAATDGGPTDGVTDGVTDGDDPTDGTDGTDSGSPSGTTGETGTPPIGYDCAAIPAGRPAVTMIPITTTEDFDFDALGSLVYSNNTDFVAVDALGGFSVVAPGIQDTRGIQILSDGNIVAAYIGLGVVGKTDRATGASTSLLTGLQGPNGLEVGDGDLLYVSEASAGRVITFDPATGTKTVIADGFGSPNGLALNQAQDRLYVADTVDGIYEVAKDPVSGDWGTPERIYAGHPYEAFDGVEVDECGNVYLVEFTQGALIRIDPTTRVAEELIDLEEPLGGQIMWNSIRWGSDRGGWSRSILYVTDRVQILAVDLGVPGRSQPVDAMP